MRILNHTPRGAFLQSTMQLWKSLRLSDIHLSAERLLLELKPPENRNFLKEPGGPDLWSPAPRTLTESVPSCD